MRSSLKWCSRYWYHTATALPAVCLERAERERAAGRQKQGRTLHRRQTWSCRREALSDEPVVDLGEVSEGRRVSSDEGAHGCSCGRGDL
jgi:hypothetical protein